MLRYMYERILELQISQGRIPGSIAVVLNPGDLDRRGLFMVRRLIEWSDSLGLTQLAIYCGDDLPEICSRLKVELSDIRADISLHTKEGSQSLGCGGRTKVIVSLGYGGKREVAEAIRKLLLEVEAGRMGPDDIDEGMIEANLRFSQRPDLVIRAGGKRLSDFMIWQAAYSELYFTEVNWNSLRRIDFLRAIRDFQRRERRYGT